jgi:hypothetical protein
MSMSQCRKRALDEAKEDEAKEEKNQRTPPGGEAQADQSCTKGVATKMGNQPIQVPDAPGSAAFMQEPDTNEAKEDEAKENLKAPVELQAMLELSTPIDKQYSPYLPGANEAPCTKGVATPDTDLHVQIKANILRAVATEDEKNDDFWWRTPPAEMGNQPIQVPDAPGWATPPGDYDSDHDGQLAAPRDLVGDKSCKFCLATKIGTKGCATCMAKCFEELRGKKPDKEFLQVSETIKLDEETDQNDSQPVDFF